MKTGAVATVKEMFEGCVPDRDAETAATGAASPITANRRERTTTALPRDVMRASASFPHLKGSDSHNG